MHPDAVGTIGPAAALASLIVAISGAACSRYALATRALLDALQIRRAGRAPERKSA